MLAQAGREPERTQVLAYLYAVVHKHVSFITGFHPDVDDLVQETVLELHAALPGFAFRSTVKTWALKIASRKARRLLRRSLSRASRVDHDADVEAYAGAADPMAKDTLDELCRHLGKIDGKKREAFVLMDILGLTAKEAAGVLGTFANTAASRCRHARAELDQLFASAAIAEPRNSTAPFDESMGAAATRGADGEVGARPSRREG